MGEYRASILNITTGLWVSSEKNGVVEYSGEEDRMLLYDEAEAEGLLEQLNDEMSDCFTLIAEGDKA